MTITQYVIPEDLAAYTAPDQNTVPTEDNGVHGDAVLTDAALGQVTTLLATGQAVHLCDGVCDPD